MASNVHIRPFRADDLDALAQVCLSIESIRAPDAHPLLPALMVAKNAVPWAKLNAKTTWVLVDDERVVGYCIACPDILDYVERYTVEYAPLLNENCRC